MKTHGPLLAFGIMLILILAVFGIVSQMNMSFAPEVPVACTQEAKICPDGSAVGRTGPNCEFAECPIIATTSENGGSVTAPTSYECNQDAKLCPDGSTVGRVGADCHFAACPLSDAKSGTIVTTIGQKKSALNVSITPIQIVEDSRCPKDVQCIWAGTVKVKAKIESALGVDDDAVLEIGTPLTTEAEEIVLTDVSPAKIPDQEIPTSSYRLTFTVTKR